jgi:hypothetical protein
MTPNEYLEETRARLRRDGNEVAVPEYRVLRSSVEVKVLDQPRTLRENELVEDFAS